MSDSERKSPLGNPLSEKRESLPEIVMVYWRDSAHVSDYDTPEEAYPYLLLYDTGFLLREDTEGIVIGTEAEDTKDSKRYRHVSSIPRENIISIQRFQPSVE